MSNNFNVELRNKAIEAALEIISIPDGYGLKKVSIEKQNCDQVFVFRYEKDSGINTGLRGEHFSFVFDADRKKLLGFTWMDQSLSGVQLPSKEEAQENARTFLEELETGLSEKLQSLWIDQHNEFIFLDGDRRKIVISGMKYKCYCEDDNTYAWVIVGPRGQIITFEQGIVWNDGRITEKWLHDGWLQGQI